MKCKHCGCDAGFKCSKCGDIRDQCKECHAELTHDIIINQNINLCRNIPHKQDSDDIDAYRVSTQTDFN